MRYPMDKYRPDNVVTQIDDQDYSFILNLQIDILLFSHLYLS